MVIDAAPTDVWEVVGQPGFSATWDIAIRGASWSKDDPTWTVIDRTERRTKRRRTLVRDAALRRLQYAVVLETGEAGRVTVTIDVIDLDDGRSLVVHATDAEPAGLITNHADTVPASLAELRSLVEAMDGHGFVERGDGRVGSAHDEGRRR